MNISKTVRASNKCLTFIEVDICHRMEPFRMVYSLTLTFIFKVEHFLAMHLLQKLRRRRMSPANLPRLARPPVIQLLLFYRSVFGTHWSHLFLRPSILWGFSDYHWLAIIDDDRLFAASLRFGYNRPFAHYSVIYYTEWSPCAFTVFNYTVVPRYSQWVRPLYLCSLTSASSDWSCRFI